jgi:glycosyltransferase involved in cell wall biosynthesis
LLSRAIESVRKQTYPHWKLLVVDNASPDDTAAVVAAAMQQDSRIGYHRHDENVGMLANWEFAISRVDTDYFSLLCDDDYLLPGFFQAAVREIARHPGIGLCFGVTNVVDDDGKHLSVAPNEMATGYYPAGEGAAAMMTLQHPATPAIVFRTACLKAVGGFDRRSLYVADLDMVLRVAFRYPVEFFEEEAACYVVHANNSFKDVTGWHPGLLNLVRNLKKLDVAEPSHVAKVFGSFGRHAILPLFVLLLRDPGKKLSPGVLFSACQCLVEMRQVSNILLRLCAAVSRRVGAALERRLSAKNSRVSRYLSRILALWAGLRQSGSRELGAAGKDRRGYAWALALLYGAGLTAFLVVFGLAELMLVHVVEKPLVKSRELLATIRRCLFGSKSP